MSKHDPQEPLRELGNAMKRAAALVDADGVVHADDLQLDPIAGSEAQASDVKQNQGSDARAFTYPADSGELDACAQDWKSATTRRLATLKKSLCW